MYPLVIVTLMLPMFVMADYKCLCSYSVETRVYADVRFCFHSFQQTIVLLVMVSITLVIVIRYYSVISSPEPIPEP